MKINIKCKFCKLFALFPSKKKLLTITQNRYEEYNICSKIFVINSFWIKTFFDYSKVSLNRENYFPKNQSFVRFWILDNLHINMTKIFFSLYSLEKYFFFVKKEKKEQNDWNAHLVVELFSVKIINLFTKLTKINWCDSVPKC